MTKGKMDKRHKISLVITGLYIVLGLAWIILGDYIVFAEMGDNKNAVKFFQNIKGVAYVLLSAIVIFLTTRFFIRKLINKETDYLKLFEKHPHPMWIFDEATNKFLDENEPAIELYGYSKEEFLKMSIFDIRSDSEKKRLKNHLESSNEDFHKNGIWKHTIKSGDELVIESSSFKLKYGEINARLVLLLDITEANAKSKKLDLEFYQLKYFRYALEQSSMLVITEKNGNVEFVNQLFLNAIEYSRDEVIGKNVNKFKAEDQDDRIFANMWRTISNGKVWRGEIKNKTRSNREIWLDMHVVPLKNKEGETEKFMSISRDITKRKEAELQLRKHTEKLQSIAWTHSHTIRKPLSSILGIAELIKLNNGTIDDITLEYLTRASNELDDALRDINSKV
jgi:PAS domain S-box-containing protein